MEQQFGISTFISGTNGWQEKGSRIILEKMHEKY